MTLIKMNTTRENMVSFLQVKYNKLNFLINKEDIFSSIISKTNKNVSSNSRYISSVIFFKDEAVPLLNMDAYLKDTFKIGRKESKSLILIIDVHRLKKKNREFLQLLYKKNDMQDRMSTNFLGLTIISDVKLITLDLFDIKLMPYSIILPLYKNGIMGASFDNEERIQYLLNIEDIIFSKLLRIKGAS